MSTEMNKTYYRIQRIIDNLSNELGYEPSLEEVAERFGSSVDRLESILNYKFSYTKIDAPFDNIKGGKTLSDVLKDENAVSPDKFAEYNSDVVELDEYLKGLKPRELFIIKKRFGFDGDEPMILKDIGSILNITRERTRQIQEIALKKIKNNFKERGRDISWMKTGSKEQNQEIRKYLKDYVDTATKFGKQYRGELLQYFLDRDNTYADWDELVVNQVKLIDVIWDTSYISDYAPTAKTSKEKEIKKIEAKLKSMVSGEVITVNQWQSDARGKIEKFSKKKTK
jgi:AraC-like DNA-binding protein